MKRVVIGILTTVNLFLLMGFDDHDEENQNGRYQVIIDIKGDQYYFDSRLEINCDWIKILWICY